MQTCPNHIKHLLEDASSRFPDEHDDFHHYFSLRCSCGQHRFRLMEGTKRSVVAVCSACGSKHRIYDLGYYTSSTKPKGDEDFKPMEGVATIPARVFIGYEYGETDEGETFDPEDITWCSIYVEEASGTLKKVFDDETA